MNTKISVFIMALFMVAIAGASPTNTIANLTTNTTVLNMQSNISALKSQMASVNANIVALNANMVTVSNSLVNDSNSLKQLESEVNTLITNDPNYTVISNRLTELSSRFNSTIATVDSSISSLTASQNGYSSQLSAISTNVVNSDKLAQQAMATSTSVINVTNTDVGASNQNISETKSLLHSNLTNPNSPLQSQISGVWLGGDIAIILSIIAIGLYLVDPLKRRERPSQSQIASQVIEAEAKARAEAEGQRVDQKRLGKVIKGKVKEAQEQQNSQVIKGEKEKMEADPMYQELLKKFTKDVKGLRAAKIGLPASSLPSYTKLQAKMSEYGMNLKEGE